jgi:hypothetical protein
MSVPRSFKVSKQDTRYLVSAFLIAAIVFYSTMFVSQAYAVTGAVTLTATVATSITFTTTTGAGDQFGTITPGTFKYATTTLDTLTNDVAGWTISLSGDNKTTANNNLELAGNAASIPDQTEWIPGAATTSAGNAVIRTSLTNSQNVLAFRLAASTTNSGALTSSTWWGASDVDGVAKFAGIASSTVQRTIGNAGTGSYSATDHYNTVNYYLNVAASQQTGAYSAPLTFTATGN